MFTATKIQVGTYLLVICLFSISFLVFVNASISFIVTKIIGETKNVGNAVGTLGFADEVVVVLASPLWGVLSDHVGARPVCVISFAIISIALGLFVQARNVFPQLLLVRLFFSIGAAGTSTMITAILPAIVATRGEHLSISSSSAQCRPENSATISPDVNVTRSSAPEQKKLENHSLPTRSAGLVGIFSACGALLALLVFLRLPDLIQRNGVGPVNALKDSYYLVGGLALLLSAVCIYGLRNLQGEAERGWKTLFQPRLEKNMDVHRGASLLRAVTLVFHVPSLGLAYLGGFVARASSVGITLFIPLLVNTYFISSGLCGDFAQDPADIGQKCRSAYLLSAELTGVSQLIGLVCAPLFGFLADKYQRYNMLLLLAAVSGFLGYLLLTTVKSPRVNGEKGSPWIYAIMALLGVNQIGVIICSLGIFSRCVLGLQTESESLESGPFDNQPCEIRNAQCPDNIIDDEGDQQSIPLLENSSTVRDLQHLKGSIAGVYSLSGGIGILLLTKLGGALFDKNTSAPFIMLSIFNALLFMAGVICGLATTWRRKTA